MLEQCPPVCKVASGPQEVRRPKSYSEDALVEHPAMALLAEPDWETRPGFDEHPGAGGPVGRAMFTDVVLEPTPRRPSQREQ